MGRLIDEQNSRSRQWGLKPCLGAFALFHTISSVYTLLLTWRVARVSVFPFLCPSSTTAPLYYFTQVRTDFLYIYTILLTWRVGVALLGVGAWVASDLRVTGSRYASGPYTPVDPRGQMTRRRLYLSFFFFIGDQEQLGTKRIVVESFGSLQLSLCTPRQTQSSLEQV